MKNLTHAVILGGILALAGCTSAPVSQAASPPAPARFGPWTGTWNNFYSYLGNPALEEAYAELAQMEGRTPAEIRDRYLNGPTYRCDIAAMNIAEGTVTFFQEPQTKANGTSGIAYRAAYQDGGEIDIGGRKWRHFFSAENIPYRHLIFLPAEADEPGVTMLHFHFRYGRDLETIKAAEGWYATMTSFDSPIQFIINHMTH
ncbi:MAG: metal-binding protein ZinT [Treponema sp.]|jgi:zinc transport system substrate-binding protein|nr:metal-binding protein ZinT [Treponema sp.]